MYYQSSCAALRSLSILQMSLELQPFHCNQPLSSPWQWLVVLRESHSLMRQAHCWF